MKSPNTTVLSYGKNPRARYHEKPQYYIARNIVDYIPFSSVPRDAPDYASKMVPFIPNFTALQSQHQTRSTSNSQIEKSKKSDNRPSKNSSIEFERLFYTELEKNKEMEARITQLIGGVEKLKLDKKVLKEHYEEFIKQMQNELQYSKSIETKYNSTDTKRRTLEEENQKLRIEVELLRQTPEQDDDEIIKELRGHIKALNQEKIDLLNSLQKHKVDIANLKTQINYYQTKEKEINNNKTREEQFLKEQLNAKEQELKELQQKNDKRDMDEAKLKNDDSEKESLKNEVSKLNNDIKKLKDELADKNNTILGLNTKINELTPTRTANTSEIGKETTRIGNSALTCYPVGTRISTYREPSRVERSPSPPPTIVRNYKNSPTIKREYVDAREKCCCCSKCDSCLNNSQINDNKSKLFHQKTGGRYTIQRSGNPSIKLSSYRNIEQSGKMGYPLNKGPNISKPIVYRNKYRQGYNNTFEQVNNMNDLDQNKIIYTKNTSPGIQDKNIDREKNNVSPRLNSKSLELYKYCDESEESTAGDKFGTPSTAKIVRGNTRVSVNGVEPNRLDSDALIHTTNNKYTNAYKSKGSNIFNERRFTHGNDSNKFSEYHYM